MFFYLTVFIVFIVRYERKGRLIFFTEALPKPYGGTKILYTPLSRGWPVRAAAIRYGRRLRCFPGVFLPFPGRSGPGGTPSCLPYYGERGRCKKKAGAVKKAGFGRGSTALPVQGFCPWTGHVLGEACGRERRLRKRSGPCPGRAAIAAGRQRGAHRGRRPPDTGKGPRKTGALADVGLSGPQAWAIPVRAASRKGDQPAGRPARRAPGSCRCCDRW